MVLVERQQYVQAVGKDGMLMDINARNAVLIAFLEQIQNAIHLLEHVMDIVKRDGLGKDVT